MIPQGGYSDPDPNEVGEGGLENLNDPANKGLWFANAHDFVVQYLLPCHVRDLGKDVRWCRDWWLHSEANARLDALWRSFEAHRVSEDANAMAAWWRDFADPTMSALTRGDGTFYRCNAREDKHADPRAGTWPSNEPYDGMFTDERTISARSFSDLTED